MNLYDLTQGALELQAMLEDGVIDEQTYADTIEAMMIGNKIESICFVIRNLEAQAEAFKAEKDRMAAKQKAAANGVQRLKDSLAAHMATLSNPKIQAGLFTVRLGISKSAEIIDENAIPLNYLIAQPPKVDKGSVLAALKNGTTVPGALLNEKPFATIR